jgi:hypothetical protein
MAAIIKSKEEILKEETMVNKSHLEEGDIYMKTRFSYKDDKGMFHDIYHEWCLLNSGMWGLFRIS